jgi:hypothetical protein
VTARQLRLPTARPVAVSSPFRFYVYTLTDPRDGKIFYVGKGQGNRLNQHERDAVRHRHANWPKEHRIREILAARKSLVAEKVAFFDDEDEAYAHEAALIASLDGLTNIMPGGWGTRSEPIKPKPKADPWPRERERLQKYLRMWDSWPNGCTFPNMPDGDALATELVEAVRKMVAEPIILVGANG